MDLRIIL